MGHKKWSPEEKETLMKLAEAGFTLKEIAASGIFKDRVYHSIHNYASNNGISLAGSKPEIDQEKFKKLLEERMK